MTETTNNTTSASHSGERGGPLILMIIGAVALAAALYYFARPADIDRSVIGMKGFARAAKIQGKLDIRFFEGSSQLDPNKIGLRILPLYDPNIFKSSNRDDRDPSNDQAQTVRSLSLSIFRRKISSIKTLVILPKWRAGVLRLEQLHPKLLIDASAFGLPIHKANNFGAPEIRHKNAGFVTDSLEWNEGVDIGMSKKGLRLELYAAQTLSDGTSGTQPCRPVARFQTQTILAECTWKSTSGSKDYKFWLLTDPDVLNNHGAKNGDNFEFGLGLVSHLASGKPIIVDGTNRVRLQRTGNRDNRERSFADLARFFAYPFSLFWVALAGLCFFGLWHSWKREGPLLKDEEGMEGTASKATAIDASVTILRGTQSNRARDFALAQKYVSHRMQAFSRDVLGKQIANKSTAQDQVLTVLARRNSVLAEKLTKVRKPFSSSAASPQSGALIAQLNQFEKTLEEARHEFGQPSKTIR